MNLPNGHTLQNGKYRISHAIGQGGFGITYKGVWYTEVKGALGTVQTEVPICIKEYFFKDYCYRDPDSFAVKVHSETGKTLFHKFKEKLIKEAKILSEVHHPHIVNVLEVFEEHHTAYIAMEYIPGCSLKYMMEKEGVLPEEKVLRYIHQIGEALDFVHDKNILHLDIKPSNILIDTTGNARLIDFGVSKRYDIEQQETSTTLLTLSKGFASIEQYDDEGILNFSPCPDIYSLGATMYNLLTGKIPTESILRATRPLSAPSEFNKNISSKTEAAIIKAMQIIPEDRFQTIKEMLASLDIPTEEVYENRWKEGYSQEDDDETTILGTEESASLNEEDDDVTIVKGEESQDNIVVPNKKKKGLWFISLIVGFSLFFIWIKKDNKNTSNTNQDFIAEIKEVKDSINNFTLDTMQIEKKKDSINVLHKEKEIIVEKKQTEKEFKENNIPVVKEELKKEKEQKAQEEKASEDVIQWEYSQLVASGKSKMEQSNFDEAQKDFNKAKELKITEEVIRLLILCGEKEAEKKLADRKAQYEMKKSFGNYTIVRKKATQLYGAIDVEANEKIPCKYLNVGIAENGRAFERQDGLYDIFNNEGVLIKEGATYY